MPDVNRNPYNFTAFATGAPWETDTSASQHATMNPGTNSGVLEINATTLSPLFIPENQDLENRSSTFFSCDDSSGTKKFTIPGSSFKGCTRSVFEAITNSRMGVSSTTPSLDEVPLFRRRASRLFILKAIPDKEKGIVGIMQECEYAFLNYNNIVVPDKRDDPNNTAVSCRPEWAPVGKNINPNDCLDICVIPWKANSLWVAPNQHRHFDNGNIRMKKHNIAYKKTENLFYLSESVYDLYKSMANHRHYNTMPQRIGNLPYNNNPYFGNVYYSTSIHTCEIDQIFFGITETYNISTEDHGSTIACFGRNVNFLWPGNTSPKMKLRLFAERPANESKREGSSMAEAVFGFIGDHNTETMTHPLRGRVRFGMLWGPSVERADTILLPVIHLMPLTAPAGTKAKCRTLYIRSINGKDNTGISWNSPQFMLRGRKMYWHQKPPANQTIADIHKYDEIANPPVPDAQQGTFATMRPIRCGVKFSGNIHFSNLTDEELGALIVSIHPGLLFEHPDHYGLKLGKGKPRGLGSIQCSPTLKLMSEPRQRYSRLTGASYSLTTVQDLQVYVNKYIDWCLDKSGTIPEGDQQIAIGTRKILFRRKPFIKDLEHLLRIPQNPSVRDYPPRFDMYMYGWLPEFDRKDGEPSNDNYPQGMDLARNIEP